MIPKIIHYCWFGPRKLSSMEERCLASWKKYCPDYEIRKWTEKDFDFSAIPYAREAQTHGAWAFLSDYARNLILAEHGGIYLDTDVELCRSLDPLLDQQGFCGVEETTINSGLGFGAVPRHPVVEALVKLYDDIPFILPDGKKNMQTNTQLQHQVFERFGFSKTKSGTIQTFSGMTAYPPEYFCPKSFRDGSMHITDKTFSIHHYHASWASSASRIGYHLRRIAGEKTYHLARNLFHVPHPMIILACFLLTFIQNLRGVLNGSDFAGGITGKILSLIMILLAGGIIGLQVLQRKSIPPVFLIAIAISSVIFVASPWNLMLLWLFILGFAVSYFPFRLFARCNIITLSCILLCWGFLLSSGTIPSESVTVKKIIWMKFYNFGFSNSNTISLFFFQMAAYAYFFIRNCKWKVLALIPLAIAIFLASGGRCYSMGMIVIAAVHFLPKRLNHFFARRFGAVIGGFMLLSLLLGYAAPSWKILYLAMNERVDMWHAHLVQDTSAKSFVTGRIWNRNPPDPVFFEQTKEKRSIAELGKIPQNIKRPAPADPAEAKTEKQSGRTLIPLDNAYLQLFINTGISGVCLFAWLMFLAFRKHRRMLIKMFPVWTAFAFCGFFESHVLGASMLGLLPVYFFFCQKGKY